MVDTVTNTALRTLLGTQNTSPQGSLSALKNNPKAQRAILEPFKNEDDNGKKLANALKQKNPLVLSDSSPLPSNLPRGSLVNLLV